MATATFLTKRTIRLFAQENGKGYMDTTGNALLDTKTVLVKILKYKLKKI